jgi:hypothetical protein
VASVTTSVPLAIRSATISALGATPRYVSPFTVNSFAAMMPVVLVPWPKVSIGSPSLSTKSNPALTFFPAPNPPPSAGWL